MGKHPVSVSVELIGNISEDMFTPMSQTRTGTIYIYFDVSNKKYKKDGLMRKNREQI